MINCEFNENLKLVIENCFMSFKIGIVGLPNVGKSTLFKALTKNEVEASNYPFCTIDPNVGIVEVPDDRLTKLAQISKSPKIVPTVIEFVDIAGLVKQAHKGEGLGNKFLANIREVDAILQVIRAFDDDDVSHVEGKLEPQRDQEIIDLELAMADLQLIDKRLVDLEKEAKANPKARPQVELLQKIKTQLEQGKAVRDINFMVGDDYHLRPKTAKDDPAPREGRDRLPKEQAQLLRELNLLTAKPQSYCFNINEHQAASFKPDFDLPEDSYLAISAKIESEVAELDPAEAKEYLAELGLKASGLEQLIVKSYKLLNLITFFTSGEMESRAWTCPAGTKAPQAASVIHTDFEEQFIRAEVISYDDFVKADGWIGARDQGTLRTEGRDYVVQDGDIINIKI